MRPVRTVLAALSLLLVATPAWAGAFPTWPAFFLECRLLAWWIVVPGLIIEYLLLRQLFRLRVVKAILADLCMNLTSTLLGIMIIPIGGLVWEVFPGGYLYPRYNLHTFSPVTWVATLVFATAFYAVLESLVLRWAFKTKIDKRRFWGLFLTNLITVGFALGSVLLHQP